VRRSTIASALALGLAASAVAAAPSDLGALAPVGPTAIVSGPAADGIGSANMSHVANVQWDNTLRSPGHPIDSQGGTDVEFATIDGRDYAFAGTYQNGLQAIDVTDPAHPVHIATKGCDILQGDVQTFTRHDRWYVTYTADDGYSNRESDCHTDVDEGGGNGTLIIDVTDPAHMETVAFLRIVGGSHNMTVHPSGDWLYNSNSGGGGGNIEVYSLDDITAPEHVTSIKLATNQEDAHDITFNADGTRAYAANIRETSIINTEDPANPFVVSTIADVSVTLHHQADPVTIGDKTFLIINDELGGAAGNEVCPGGGLHVWDITDETSPVKVGAWFAPEITVREGAQTGTGGTVTCTSHVFRIYPEHQLMTIAWFGLGVHVIDLSNLDDVAGGAIGVGVGAQGLGGMAELGFYRFAEDSDAWAAKAYRFDEDGSFHVFANDQTRGFDVYRFDASAAPAQAPGTWLNEAQALQRTFDLYAGGFVPGPPVCQIRASVPAARRQAG